jgi:chromate transport protein ChrA
MDWARKAKDKCNIDDQNRGYRLRYYLFVIIPAKYFRRFAKNFHVKAFVDGVTAATGAIAGAVYVLARRSLIDLPTVLIGITTLVILMLTKKIPEPLVILVSGVAGILVRGTVGRKALTRRLDSEFCCLLSVVLATSHRGAI